MCFLTVCPSSNLFLLLLLLSSHCFFFFLNWRLITLQQYCGFCHTFSWISHGCTCVPHPDPPSHLSPHPIPQGPPNALLVISCGTLSNSTSWNTLPHNQEFPTGKRQPIYRLVLFIILLFSHQVMLDSTRPHVPQHARLPCPSPSPTVSQVHVHWFSDAIQPSHSLLPFSPSAFSLSQR